MLLLVNGSFSQNYGRADSIAHTYPHRYNTVEQLAKQISQDFDNDFDKVRALYTWIAMHVKYDIKETGGYNFSYYDDKDRIQKMMMYNKKLSKRVVNRKIAVCEGYSVLFHSTCQLLDIKSQVISGYAKTKVSDIGKPLKKNHAWNTVTINDERFLIDVTWGSNEVKDSKINDVNYNYFFTRPIWFITNHYPQQYKDALLKHHVTKESFSNAPVFHSFDYHFIEPIEGTLKKDSLNKVYLEVVSKNEITQIQYTIATQFYKTEAFTKEDSRFKLEIDLSEIKRARTMILYLNRKPVASFKIE